MLTLALAATLVGFVLLVVGLITGTLWLAIACIVVCLVGLIFLVADIVWSGRRGKPDDEEAGGGFGFGAAQHVDEDGDDADDSRHTPRRPEDGRPEDSGPQSESAPHEDSDQQSTEDRRRALWEGVISSPDAPETAGGPRGGDPRPPESVPTQAAPPPTRPGAPAADRPTAPSTAERGYADYLRSVGAADARPRPPVSNPSITNPAVSNPAGPNPTGPNPAGPNTGSDPRGRQRPPGPPQTGRFRPGPAPTPQGSRGTHSDPGSTTQSGESEPGERPEKIDPLHPDWRPPQQ